MLANDFNNGSIAGILRNHQNPSAIAFLKARKYRNQRPFFCAPHAIR